ncbi:FAD-dependent oxidoreductase [Streptomyces sp. NPDC054841]
MTSAFSLPDSTPQDGAVCIIGAGPAGLTLAVKLERAGYTVTVLDFKDELGGWTGDVVRVAGREYEIESPRFSSADRRVAALVTACRAPIEAAMPPAVLQLDGTAAKRSTLRRAAFVYLPTREALFPHIDEPGLAHSETVLAAPAAKWLAEQELDVVAEALGQRYTAEGHGYLDEDMPALYFLSWVEAGGQLLAGLPGNPTALGNGTDFLLTGGWRQLWECLAASLRDVRCSVDIEHIRRSSSRVTVQTGIGTVEANRLVIAVPLDEVIHLLDASGQEKNLAARIRRVDYQTALCSVTGLSAQADDALLLPNATSAAHRGHCVALRRPYPDQDVYLASSYLAPGLGEQERIELLREDMARLGGRLVEVHAQADRHGRPYFGPDDLRAGSYRSLTELQGQLRTYYADTFPAFGSVEQVLAHAEQLAETYFSGTRPPPSTADRDRSPSPTPVPPSWCSPVGGAELSGWLRERVAGLTALPKESVDAAAPLGGYGMHSLSIAELTAGLTSLLGRPVDFALVYGASSIESLVTELTGPEDPPSQDHRPDSR